MQNQKATEESWSGEFDGRMTSFDRYGGFYHGTKDGVELYNFDNIKSFITHLLTSERADWLRSEIEKLEESKGRRHPNDLFFQDCPHCGEMANEAFVADKFVEVWDDALTSIITRYKEELLELEKGV